MPASSAVWHGVVFWQEEVSGPPESPNIGSEFGHEFRVLADAEIIKFQWLAANSEELFRVRKPVLRPNSSYRPH